MRNKDQRSQVNIVPLTLPKANACVSRWHRHHAPIPGGFGWFCVGAIVDGELVGAAIAGRPTNRNNDDGQTVEVLRLATNGAPNAASALLGACARAARAIGARRVLTYTLDHESGASLRGAGWIREADGIQSWWMHTGVRWALNIRERIDYAAEESPDRVTQEQSALFAGLETKNGRAKSVRQPRTPAPAGGSAPEARPMRVARRARR